MQNELIRFSRMLLLLSLAAGALLYLFTYRLFPQFEGHYIWYILFYFMAATAGFHFGLLKSLRGKPQQFVRYYMAATALKLFLHLVVIILYSITHRTEALGFIICFFLLYVVYTVLEVSEAMRLNRKPLA